MNVAVVTVGYNLPGRTKTLFDSAHEGCCHDLTFLVFLHSQMPEKVDELERLARRTDVIYHDYGENRGLAKSWNEGIIEAFEKGFDVVLVANEDLKFSPQDIDVLVAAAVSHPECYVVTGRAFHYSEQAWSSSEYGGFVINPIALATLGCFDENLFPIYYEDADYRRRAALARTASWFCEQTRMYHGGSDSLSQPEVAQQNSITWAKN